ncbi:tRNA adenosine deaminase-associated protein [Kribbella deserti]|uniref:tRNA adenosine deaminase-associated protein n=1 Tax=Kribbella deserti TaxID=1926257 RepID=A0ABV6R0M1_9ACTN
MSEPTAGTTTTTETELDFAVAAYREDGDWQVTPLVLPDEPDLATLISALRRFPSESGVLGLISVDEDFFLLMRVIGGRARLLLSDVTAGSEWPLARQVLDELRIPVTDDDDDPMAAGDLEIVADLGLSPMDLSALCDDVDLYPEEMLEEIADALGFGRQFHDTLESLG